MPVDELYELMLDMKIPEEKYQVGEQIIKEITNRLKLLIDIGMNYISLNRRADTLSGGETQRIRLSTQISSGLAGMLYVLDEPSIGLHARDTYRIIGTIKTPEDIIKVPQSHTGAFLKKVLQVAGAICLSCL